MMAGKILFPVEGSFGSCLHPKKQDVRIFDLGFATPVRLTAGAAIDGVVKGSAAERAGSRNGDVLDESVDINPIASSLDEPIVLHVRRVGAPVTITYQPSAGMQPGMAWTSSCAR
jgi:S1-C subfamily serine protease